MTLAAVRNKLMRHKCHEQQNIPVPLGAELEAIEAIYGTPNVVWKPSQSWKISNDLGSLFITTTTHSTEGSLDDIDESCSLLIEFHLSEDFPNKPPKCFINAPWVYHRALLNELATSAVGKHNGQGCLFEIIEAIRAAVPAPDFTSEKSSTKQHLECYNLEKEQEQIEEVLPDRKESAEHVLLGCSHNIISGDALVDRKSVFQAHVAEVHSKAEAYSVLEQLKQQPKIKRATHNIMAYRLECQKPLSNASVLMQDHDSDGEGAAGGRLQHLLEILDIKNVVVVVSRWYGGIHLGPQRFKHINNVARELLIQTNIGSKTQKSRK